MSQINLEKLSISGFRAFLQEQHFLLFQKGSPKSLAIFAPNAKGKSSLIDAIEYFFSKDGTLKRIGLRRSGTQAGREALEHYKSKEKDVPSKISMFFNQSNNTFGDTRVITSINQIRPSSAKKLLDSIKVEFIIRGYELRRFVEDQT
ncbi:MAG: AAA family ATPase, partial [Bacteroidetes bacterium]|nr:AAA family ATPase [Bacteroidota bacterium]